LNAAILFLVFSSFAIGQDAPIPKATAPVSPEKTPLPPDLLDRILALIADNGTDLELSSGAAGALGFTGNGQPWLNRQIGARADESDSSTPLHIIAIGRGAGEDLLICVWNNGLVHYFRVLRNGQVVRAIAKDTAGEPAPIRTPRRTIRGKCRI
jgi:hypothetical protein